MTNDMFSLKGKVALVTGAVYGIGFAIAEALASAGATIVFNDRNESGVEKGLANYAEKGIKAYGYVCDVTDEPGVQEMVKKIEAEVGVIDILVNNAGLALGLAPYQDYEELDMLTMLDTNVKGLMAVIRCFLPSMVAANQGHIINMGSTAGIYAYAGAAVYSATKAAVKTFSDGLRIDTIATDIKVTTIQPGIVETDFSKVRFHGDEARAATVYQGLEALQAQDIADAVVYVTSQPRRVQITDMTIMANQQATGFMIHRD